MNPEPFTVTVVAAAPAVALDGETEVTVGAGFGFCGGGLLFEPPPPPPQADSRKVDRKKRTETTKGLKLRRRVAKHIELGPHSRHRDGSVKQSSWIFPVKKGQRVLVREFAAVPGSITVSVKSKRFS